MRISLLAIAIAIAAPVYAQDSKPQPLPFAETIPAARDIAYPGTIRIAIDATDLARRIYRVKQTIPVAGAGPMVMLFPEWLPGNHAPRGPIASIAGIKFSAGGRAIPWRRDPVDVYAFHLDIPAGVTEIEAEFQHLSPTDSAQGRVTMTPAMLNLQWEKMTLYPAGYFVRNIPVSATVKYPAGFKAATSLDVASTAGQDVTYRTVPYETLVDSPVFAGLHYRKWDLGQSMNLNVFADRPEDLAAKDEHIAAHKRLATQAIKLYRGKHYDEYEFLVALTDKLGGIGLEHLRSSENSHPREYFTEWDKRSAGRDLLAHELNHSWDGKWRRPADLFTPDYRVPMRDSGLWVYEGQTQFWGNILSARSGMQSKEDVLSELARTAAYYDTLPGRSWRPLADTTSDPIIAARRPKPFSTWQRSEDYYSEGMLIWLDVDSIIRERTGGRKSIDDFARAFFGLRDGDQGILTYTQADVVETLNAITPYDWASYLDRRLNETGKAPLEWIARGGYRLVYRDEPSDYFKSRELDRSILDLSHTIGITIGKEGEISSVAWDSPLFNQGVTSGAKIVAIDGRQYANADFKEAIKAAKTSRKPIQLLIKQGETYRTVPLAYYDGLRYPALEKVGRGETGLDKLLKPLP